MTWATGTSETPRLRTYAEAKAHEAKVVPIKNKKRTEPCKPLGRRDCTDLTIRKEGRKIVVRLYSEDRVVYHPGGKIDVIAPHGGVGITDSNLFRSMLGLQVRHFNGRSWLYCNDGKMTGWLPMKKGEKAHHRSYRAPSGELKAHTFTTDTYTATVVLEAPPFTGYRMLGVKYPERHVLNREGAKQVRDRYKEFGKLLKGVLKLERMALEDGSGAYAGNNGTYVVQKKAREISDTELFAYIKSKDVRQQMQAAQLLAQRHAETNHTWDWRARASTQTKKIDGKKVTDDFYRVIYQAHKKEAYATEVITDGRLVKNRHHV